jgi:hypothetical protein
VKLRLAANSDINNSASTTKSEVDAIANAMDNCSYNSLQSNKKDSIESRSKQCGLHYNYNNDNAHIKNRNLNKPESNCPKLKQTSDIKNNSLDVSPEAMAQRMAKQYMQQNGGIIINQNSEKKNRIILG